MKKLSINANAPISEILPYVGGKANMAKQILTYFPSDIKVYVEPFSGMMRVFFQMDFTKFPQLEKIVYNDYNKLNVNFFRCLRHPEKLLYACQSLKIHSPTVFKQAKAELFADDFKIDLRRNDFDVAAKYAYLMCYVFSGTNPEKGSYTRPMEGRKHKWETFTDRLQSSKWHRYFLMIDVIENLDFEDCIRRYDTGYTMFYTDPPYYKTETLYANHDFGLKDHKRLSDVLRSIRGYFILSYYEFDQLNQWYKGARYRWHTVSVKKSSGASKGKTLNTATELLITNYENN
jgi:DNA adenine methylase